MPPRGSRDGGHWSDDFREFIQSLGHYPKLGKLKDEAAKWVNRDTLDTYMSTVKKVSEAIDIAGIKMDDTRLTILCMALPVAALVALMHLKWQHRLVLGGMTAMVYPFPGMALAMTAILPHLGLTSEKGRKDTQNIAWLLAAGTAVAVGLTATGYVDMGVGLALVAACLVMTTGCVVTVMTKHSTIGDYKMFYILLALVVTVLAGVAAINYPSLKTWVECADYWADTELRTMCKEAVRTRLKRELTRGVQQEDTTSSLKQYFYSMKIGWSGVFGTEWLWISSLLTQVMITAALLFVPVCNIFGQISRMRGNVGARINANKGKSEVFEEALPEFRWTDAIKLSAYGDVMAMLASAAITASIQPTQGMINIGVMVLSAVLSLCIYQIVCARDYERLGIAGQAFLDRIKGKEQYLMIGNTYKIHTEQAVRAVVFGLVLAGMTVFAAGFFPMSVSIMIGVVSTAMATQKAISTSTLMHITYGLSLAFQVKFGLAAILYGIIIWGLHEHERHLGRRNKVKLQDATDNVETLAHELLVE